MRSLLLVTGSRSLDPKYVKSPGSHDAEVWARGILCQYTCKLSGRYPIVLTGGCPYGPDRWAAEIADLNGIDYVEMCLDGIRWNNGVPGLPWAHPGERTLAGRKFPLHRNRSMILEACTCAQCGWNVQVLALFASEKTGGTMHTVRTAEENGLCVAEYAFHKMKNHAYR